MNKKFFISTLIVFVVWMFGSFVVHGMLLGSDYAQLPGLFRTEAESQQYFPLMLLAHVLMSGAFVWIYSKGVESKPWIGQGLCFGVAVAVLAIIPTYIIYYVVQPMPGALVVKQILFDGLLLLVVGTVTAFLYRDAAR